MILLGTLEIVATVCAEVDTAIGKVSSGDKRPVWLDSGEAGVRVWICRRDGSGALAGLWSWDPTLIQDRNHTAFFKGLCELMYAHAYPVPGTQ